MNSPLFEPSLKYYLIILFYFFLGQFFKFLSVGQVFKEDKNFRRWDVAMMWYDTIFIYCNWVSIWWQWSVNLYQNRKGTTIHKTRNNTQNNKKPWMYKIQNKKTNTKIVLRVKDASNVNRKYQREANNKENTYCTEATYSCITINQW
jgi:hypothetical protein